MIFGYAREHDFPRLLSLQHQGRAIANYCKNVLNEPFDEKNLYVDYRVKGRSAKKIEEREAASLLFFRIQNGDKIVVSSFGVLFLADKDIARLAKFTKDGRVEIHLVDKGKKLNSLSSEELLGCMREAKENIKRGEWGGVILTPDGKIPAGKTRWVKIPGTSCDWLKVSETKDGVVPVLLKAQRLKEIVKLDEANRAIEYERFTKFLTSQKAES